MQWLQWSIDDKEKACGRKTAFIEAITENDLSVRLVIRETDALHMESTNI